MSRSRTRLLAAIVVAQVFLLVGMTALQGARVASGTHVVLEVVPVDPLDLARGAYVDLRYEVAELDLPEGTGEGDEVWIELQRPASGGGAWRGVRVVDDIDDLEPGDVFLRGRASEGGVDLAAIETYYASADEAVRLERELADGGLATVSLADDGAPTLVEVSGGD